jgi:hypothetical protein
MALVRVSGGAVSVGFQYLVGEQVRMLGEDRLGKLLKWH